MVGTTTEEEPDEGQPRRLGNASAEQYGIFRDALTPAGRHMSDSLQKTQRGEIDSCFLEVATEEAKAAPRPFAWPDLFTTAGSEAKGKRKREAEGDTLPLTDLRAACHQLLKSLWAAPEAAGSGARLGAEDRSVMAAVGADVEEDDGR